MRKSSVIVTESANILITHQMYEMRFPVMY